MFGALLTLAMALGACAPRPRTQVMVIVQADDVIGPQIDHVLLRVRGGRTPQDLILVSEETPAFDVVRPLRVAVIPSGGDTSRYLEVEATALRGTEELAVLRTVSQFQARELVTIELRFEACCAGVMCAATETCRSCRCQPATGVPLDAAVSPDAAVLPGEDAFSFDAGVDVWTPSVDAFAQPDAFVDPCPPLSCLRIPLLSDIGFSPARGPVFARPIGTTCPAATLSTPDFGLGAIHLYNESTRARTMRLTTQRFGTGLSYDPTLIVYDTDGVGPLSPPSPLACSKVSDDAVGMDAQVTFTLAPMQAKLVVLTGATSGPIPSNVQIRIEQL